MYKYSYIPIVCIEDVSTAMEARFGRTVSIEELFDEFHKNTYMYYSLDRDKEVGQLRPEIAILYTLMKTVLKKDFQIHTKGVLIEID